MTQAVQRRVVDASLAVKAFLPEEFADRASQLLRRGRADPLLELHSPDLVYVESANVLWKYVRRTELTPERANAYLHQLNAVGLTVHSTRELALAALGLAVKHGISAYDGCYVALAQALGCELVTADQRLVNRLSEELPFVRWLGEAEFAVAEGVPGDAS